MEERDSWQSVINGKTYTFSYHQKSSEHHLSVNGVTHTARQRLTHMVLDFDEPLRFDGIDARFVIENKTPDVVVDGVYLRSGKTYRPRPIWAPILALICFAVPFIMSGELVSIVLGFAGAVLCIRISKSALPSVLRFLLCALFALGISFFVLAPSEWFDFISLTQRA